MYGKLLVINMKKVNIERLYRVKKMLTGQGKLL